MQVHNLKHREDTEPGMPGFSVSKGVQEIIVKTGPHFPVCLKQDTSDLRPNPPLGLKFLFCPAGVLNSSLIVRPSISVLLQEFIASFAALASSGELKSTKPNLGKESTALQQGQPPSIQRAKYLITGTCGILSVTVPFKSCGLATRDTRAETVLLSAAFKLLLSSLLWRNRALRDNDLLLLFCAKHTVQCSDGMLGNSLSTSVPSLPHPNQRK